jgi:predicted metal-dependent HD superfamily phosphohydrolase
MADEIAQEFFSIDEKTAATLRDGLENLLKTYSGDERKATEIADMLVAKYSEKRRAYHNLWHINTLLAGVDGWQSDLSDQETVRLAVWFHDAIYEPRKQTSETESAALAVESLLALNFPVAKIKRVEKMILATQKHMAKGLDDDGRLFLDFDLSILSAAPAIYKKYAQAIRREYSFVPEALYREKRREILQRLLQREKIFFTNKVKKLTESAARANIANEIKELS